MRKHASLGFLAGLVAFACLIGMGGCETAATRKQAAHNVRVASANLHAVGDHLEESDGVEAEGRTVNSQTDIIDHALGIPPENRVEMATVTLARWRATLGDLDAKSRLAVEARAKAQELTGQLEAAKKDAAWYRNITNSAGVAAAVGILGAIGSAFGVPWLTPIGRLICRKGFLKLEGQVADLTDKNEVAIATVNASDTGREALAALDAILSRQRPEVAQAIRESMQNLTGKPVEGVQDLFKTYAKASAVDQGMQQAVDGLLRGLRDDADTVGGRPKAFIDVLAAQSVRTA